MTMGDSLFDPQRFDAAASTRGRDEGMQRVDGAAAPDWRSTALLAIRLTAVHLEHFTTDDVWRRLPSTGENRALGPLMRVASRNGWCVATDDFRLTEQRSRHRAPVRVWKSRIYGTQ